MIRSQFALFKLNLSSGWMRGAYSDYSIACTVATAVDPNLWGEGRGQGHGKIALSRGGHAT